MSFKKEDIRKAPKDFINKLEDDLSHGEFELLKNYVNYKISNNFSKEGQPIKTKITIIIKPN